MKVLVLSPEWFGEKEVQAHVVGLIHGWYQHRVIQSSKPLNPLFTRKRTPPKQEPTDDAPFWATLRAKSMAE